MENPSILHFSSSPKGRQLWSTGLVTWVLGSYEGGDDRREEF